tara:strand:- start:2564 stop:4453 length:1890 start_codon:yes stop_codon:yes gene_type:complete
MCCSDGEIIKNGQGSDSGEEDIYICEVGEFYECDYGFNTGECQKPIKYCFGTFWGECVGGVTATDELCDGLDNDCDERIDEGTLNGCGLCGPTPIELCNDIDDDCDGATDEGFRFNDDICNGIDDDCDGAIDEGWSKRLSCLPEGGTGDWISYEENSGCHYGWRLCIEGDFTDCFDYQGPVPEVCNGIDDDCDSQVDEVVISEPCGVNDVGQCEYGSFLCIDTEMLCHGVILPENEVCDGIDNDCDGITDEGLIRECETACEVGIETCFNGNWRNCTASSPTTEICNNFDDDCDGDVDEDLDCPCNVGDHTICINEPCGYGIQYCTEDLVWSDCEGNVPSNELCNDHDDDCDLAVDEALVRDCYDGPVGTIDIAHCEGGSSTCFRGHWLQCIDQSLPEDEICDGIDNDCDGNVDNMERYFEKVDFIFAIDVSGSMNSTIESAKDALELYVASFTGTEHLFGLVIFGEIDVPHSTEAGAGRLLSQPSSIADFITALEDLPGDGGIEPSLDVVYDLASPENPLQINWRNNATPIIVLITDEIAQSNRSLDNTTVYNQIHPCQLPGCNSATNINWVDNDPLEVFIITDRQFFTAWEQIVPIDKQRVYNLDFLNPGQFDVEIELIFSEACVGG